MKKKTCIFLLLLVLMVQLCVIGAGAVEEATVAGVYGLTVTNSNVTVEPQDASGAKITAAGVTIKETTESLYAGAVKFKVSYTAAQEGSFYLVLVLNSKATVPTAESLTYIDQATAGETTVSFNTVYPSEMESGQTYSIYLASNASSGVTSIEKVAEFKYFVPYTLGDVNEDRKITATDALWVLQSVAGNRTLSANAQLAANVNKDLKISATDALWILQAVAGNRTLS